MLIYTLKAIAVVTAVLWLPAGALGLYHIIKWAISDKRRWDRAYDEEIDNDEGEEGEVTYI